MLAPAPATVVRTAPAKINLALHVTGRRADGYHLLDTLVVFAGPGDTIRLDPAGEDRLAITGPLASGLGGGPDNLVIRAREALRGAAPSRLLPPVAITLEKNLPLASGIGGGSADAAATLCALNAFWNLGLSAERLAALGLDLGADVPMCLAGRPLRARGVGEDLTALARFPALDLVLVNPGSAVPTPEVFRRLAEHHNEPLPPLPTLHGVTDAASWLATTRNDLEAPARSIALAIDTTLESLRQAGALLARMSGSGATCFGLFADADDAQQAAQSIRRVHPEWFVAATKSGGAGDAAR